MSTLCVIGGFDPTGHAGVMRDCEAAARVGVTAHVVVTALTVQSDKEYFGHFIQSPNQIRLQWQPIPLKKIRAIKIGMLGSLSVVREIVTQLKKLKRVNPRVKIVWDPVFASSSGGMLLSKSGIAYALKHLLPLCDVVTPNAHEMKHLITVQCDDPEKQVKLFWERYRVAVYLKGGHFRSRSIDWLCSNGKIVELKTKLSPRVVRGTGCYLASVLAALLSQGTGLLSAARITKKMMAEKFRETG